MNRVSKHNFGIFLIEVIILPTRFHWIKHGFD